MSWNPKKLAATVLATASLLVSQAQAQAQAPQSAVERLSWLAGCWRSDGADAGSGEHWTPVAGGTLLGVGRSVRQGATVSHEFMQIREAADGKVVFIAQPAGKAETVFTLMAGGATEASFENPEHDFPQRVIYRLEGAGRLRARIEGMRAGVPRAMDFAYTRVACDAQPALPDAFQGLPWGATEAQMALRFGPALKRAECTLQERRSPTRPAEACDHPVLAPYAVAGVPFKLDLQVDSTARQLVRVVLSHAADVGPTAADNGWGEKHRLLRQLLTQRYGGPESTHITTDEGVSRATARWRRGDTLIELNSTFHNRSGAAWRDHVEIVYQPVTAGDAGKL
jgi:hypothetical protein